MSEPAANTVELSKQTSTPAAPEPEPEPPAGVLRRRSRSAVARSAARDRGIAVLIGLLLLVTGTLVALLSFGVFGSMRAGRPVLDPVIVEALGTQSTVSRIVAIAVGILLTLLGLTWAARSLRPERRPDLVLAAGGATEIVVSSAAAADAVATEAGRIPGVGRVRARLVGPERAPALRLTLWITDDADVQDVLRRVDGQVLASARASLGLGALPAAVRIELDTAASASRVA